jgi:hypothetical protein
MLQIEPTADSDGANAPWHLNDPDLELSRMAVTDADWQAMQLNDEDLVTPSAEEVLAMTNADWVRLRLPPSVLTRLRDDLIHRLGVNARDLSWLNRAIERGQHGHARAQTGAD